MDKIVSKALDANLAQTRSIKVSLPAGDEALIALSSEFYGINNRCREFVLEFHHPYSNPGTTLKMLRELLLSDAWFYSKPENSSKAYPLFLSYLRKLCETCVDQELADQLLLMTSEWILLLLDKVSCLPEIVLSLMAIMENWRIQNPEVFIRGCGIYRNVLLRITAILPAGEQIKAGGLPEIIPEYPVEQIEAQHMLTTLDIIRELLSMNATHWESVTGFDTWWEKMEIEGGEDLENQLGKGLYAKIRSDLAHCQTAEQLASIPSYQDLANHYRRSAVLITDDSSRVQYIFYLLTLPAMSTLYKHLLFDLNRILRDISLELSSEDMIRFLAMFFERIEPYRHSHPDNILDCLWTIGKVVGSSEERALIDSWLDYLISFGFVHPSPLKVRDDWQLDFDKNHIKNIRIWMELIALNPRRSGRLLSALIVNLRLGGVFISDTDLFQKDISVFLNADIHGQWKQVQQLLRLFPVFFGEIGAEGEIREVTTAMDELFQRQDRLIHFLRKQVHAESNHTQIELVEKILRYWESGEPGILATLLPEGLLRDMADSPEHCDNMRRTMHNFMRDKHESLDELLSCGRDELEASFRDSRDTEDKHLRKLYLIFLLHELLLEKYSFQSSDIVRQMEKYPFFEQRELQQMRRLLSHSDYDNTIRYLMEMMDKLRHIVQNPTPGQGWENIYYKRHIAAGIPSMYGQYRESKFEAMGLIFRLENLISKLMEKNLSTINLGYITARTLRRIIRTLELFNMGLKQSGILNETFENDLQILRYSVSVSNFSIDQYINIFSFLEEGVKEMISGYFYRNYDRELSLIIPQITGMDMSENAGNQAEYQKKAEEFYRNMLSTAFLIRDLDNFVSRILVSLRNMKQLFTPEILHKVTNYDPEQVSTNLHKKDSRLDNQVFLGAKAYFLKKLCQEQFPIPGGFVFTTELFGHRQALNVHPEMGRELDQLIARRLANLENYSGRKFGDPQNPLLLSVRSGGAISMPGAMNTFLNIGLNDEITEKLSKVPNFGWTAWDSYRRLLQSWGMSHGIQRDEFDQVMIDYKERFGVTQKTAFSPLQMSRMTSDYKQILAKHGVALEQDPMVQLKNAMLSVLDSWDSERAELYRKVMHIANEWGTAVICQEMVFGNISLRSGSGVAFTHDPLSKKPGVNLTGDFTICSQGEDVVAGLVYTLPISEEQRLTSLEPLEQSLEKDFPDVYNCLRRFARRLVNDLGYSHQEIEFTFQGDREEDLFILQIRDQKIHNERIVRVFSAGNRNMKAVGHGIGIGSGVLNGIVVFDEEDILSMKNALPGEHLILVRPDTVPDDIELIVQCSGLLTSRGGATSHAAVTATRLNRIGVVNCRNMVVSEKTKVCNIGSTVIPVGSRIAIDGHNGSIYLDHYQIDEIFIT